MFVELSVSQRYNFLKKYNGDIAVSQQKSCCAWIILFTKAVVWYNTVQNFQSEWFKWVMELQQLELLLTCCFSSLGQFILYHVANPSDFLEEGNMLPYLFLFPELKWSTRFTLFLIVWLLPGQFPLKFCCNEESVCLVILYPVCLGCHCCIILPSCEPSYRNLMSYLPYLHVQMYVVWDDKSYWGHTDATWGMPLLVTI